MRMTRRWTIDVFVHIATEHVGMKTRVRRQKDCDEKVRDCARFSRALGRTVCVLSGFQMNHEDMQRLREIRHGDLGFKKVPREIRVRITDRKSTRLNSSHIPLSRMPSSA